MIRAWSDTCTGSGNANTEIIRMQERIAELERQRDDLLFRVECETYAAQQMRSERDSALRRAADEAGEELCIIPPWLYCVLGLTWPVLRLVYRRPFRREQAQRIAELERDNARHLQTILDLQANAQALARASDGAVRREKVLREGINALLWPQLKQSEPGHWYDAQLEKLLKAADEAGEQCE